MDGTTLFISLKPSCFLVRFGCRDFEDPLHSLREVGEFSMRFTVIVFCNSFPVYMLVNRSLSRKPVV